MHTLHAIQKLPISVEEAWDFLSSPANLQVITPPHMGFEITSAYHGEEMYAGQIITYIVKPILGIPIDWCTEITQVDKPHYFIDEQRFGPYAFWHHQHKLKPIKNGVEMEDIVHYKLPLWGIGKIVNAVLVKNQLKDIFDYRRKKVEELFGKYDG